MNSLVLVAALVTFLSQTDPTAEPTPTLKTKFGEGVTFESGDFKLQLRGRVQLRADTTIPGAGSSTPLVAEMMARRARLVLTGNYGKDWQFTTQLAFANLDMEADAPNILRDAFVTWQHFRDLNVRVGQMKVPFGRQRVVSSSALQMTDRSIVVGELNLDRDVGITLRSEDFLGLGGRVQYQLGVMGGDGRNRLGTNAGLLYVARVQFNPFGSFSDLSEGDLGREDHVRLAIGFAYARNNHTVRARSTLGATYKNGSTTYDHAAADLALKWRGFSLTSEVLYRRAVDERLAGATSTEWARSGWGYMVQAGYLPVDQFEISARWGQLRPFSGTDPNFHQQRELGGGLSWYPAKHNLKLQADYFWLPVGENFGVGNHQVRVQLQLYF